MRKYCSEGDSTRKARRPHVSRLFQSFLDYNHGDVDPMLLELHPLSEKATRQDCLCRLEKRHSVDIYFPYSMKPDTVPDNRPRTPPGSGRFFERIHQRKPSQHLFGRLLRLATKPSTYNNGRGGILQEIGLHLNSIRVS